MRGLIFFCPLNALQEPFSPFCFFFLLLSLHHSLSFFFNKYCGSVSIVKPRAVQILLIFVVLLWSRRRHGVFRNGAIFYITWQIPVSIEGPWYKSRVEMEGKCSSCGYICDAGVGNHWSITVGCAPTSCFPFKVKC